MLRPLKILLIFSGTLVLSCLNAQSISARVVDEEMQAIPFTNIIIEASGKSVMTNENGVFYLDSTNIVGDSILISKHGYEDKSLAIRSLHERQEDVELKQAERLSPNEIATYTTASSVLIDALENIDLNYPQRNSILEGFYKEQIADKKARILMYGEGGMKSLKKPYLNRNSLESDRGRTLLSDIRLEKGFAEYLPQRLKDRHYLKSKYLKREDCTSMIDKSDILQWRLNFLTVKGMSNYAFDFSHLISKVGQKELVIKFSPNGKNAFYQGEIGINMEDMAIVYCEYALTQKGRSQVNSLNPLLFLVENRRKVEYRKLDGVYSLSQAHINSEYIYLATGDTLTDHVSYVTTDRITNEGDGLLSFDESPAQIIRASSLPIVSSYWGDRLIVERTVDVRELFETSSSTSSLNSPTFKIASIEEIQAQTRRERKFALIYIPSENCERCLNIDSLVNEDNRFHQAIADDFIRFRLESKQKGARALLGQFYQKEFDQIAILSPWGHPVNVIRLYKSEGELSSLLNTLVEGADLESIYEKIDNLADPGSEIDLAGKELMARSFDNLAIDNNLFYKSVLGARKTWREKDKRRLIFRLLETCFDKEIQNYFLDHLIEYQNLYTTEELNEAIYKLTFRYPVGKPDFPTLSNFLQKYIIGDSAYYLLKAEADFFRIIIPEESIRLEVLIELYQKFQYDEWSEFRSVFLEMILAAETQMDFYKLEGIALSYKPYSVEHEWLDLYSLLLYRSGLEEEGLGMIGEVLAKALEKGINYRPAIYGLRNKK